MCVDKPTKHENLSNICAETTAMVIDLEHLKSKLLPVFSKYRNELVAAYLFGSLAEKAQTAGSDIDIAILLKDQNNERSAKSKLLIYADLCRVLQRNDVDLVMLGLSGNLILNAKIIRNGILLYSIEDDFREDFELRMLHSCTDFEHQRRYAMGE